MAPTVLELIGSIEAGRDSRYSQAVTTVPKRLQQLRQAMAGEGLDACLVFSTDPFMSEYVPPRWAGRAYLSGFDGSAGTLAVTADNAALWTDGRYFLQAAKQLAGSGIELMREGQPETPSLAQWLAGQLKNPETTDVLPAIGTAADCVGLAQARRLQSECAAAGVGLQPGRDLLNDCWPDRPGVPGSPVVEFSADEAGESRAQRLARFRARLVASGVDMALVSSLDDLAYLLLLRGSDIQYNPVAVGCALIDQRRVRLYLPPGKHSSAAFLQQDGIELLRLEDLPDDLAGLPQGSRLLIDPARTNLALYQAVNEGVTVKEARLPSVVMKSVKNEQEAANIRTVMEIDGAAMVRFLRWLTQHPAVEELDEWSAAAKLQQLRSEHSEYRDDSFPYIAGFGPNGAVVHYAVEQQSAQVFSRDTLFLIDSGAHYRGGTTDITRVVGWQPSEAMKRDYTLVLKAHIALSVARFPAGTRGIQLDSLARAPLWQQGLDYAHGTGHGVGYCLPVHEGPQSISTRLIDQPLLPGMVTSNEPGLYRAGQYGVRIENLLYTVVDHDAEGFLRFETLTLCPYERNLIDVSLLTADEVAWVNAYHAEVCRRLQSRLTGDDWNWLQQATAALESANTRSIEP